MKYQLPPESVVVVPRELPSTNNSTVEPASAIPVKAGVASLVRLSISELPVSEAGFRSGVEGADGGVSSSTSFVVTSEATDSENLLHPYK